MSSGASLDGNLALADTVLAAAAKDRCVLALLPENFALIGVRDEDKLVHAEPPGEGPIQAYLADAAKRFRMWIVGGSIPLASPRPGVCFGACPVYDDSGVQRCLYRKIHLFDVDLPSHGQSYRESATMDRGDEVVTQETPYGSVGLTICYDLRFPELFRRLVDQGAGIFTVPAAFTDVTGAAHWHVLLRARATENLAYVIAAGQHGDHPNGRKTFGHSMIVDPWGRILAEQADGDGAVIAEIDPGLPAKLRAEFPALEHRRL